jgi:hypothetical protein
MLIFYLTSNRILTSQFNLKDNLIILGKTLPLLVMNIDKNRYIIEWKSSEQMIIWLRILRMIYLRLYHQ